MHVCVLRVGMITRFMLHEMSKERVAASHATYATVGML